MPNCSVTCAGTFFLFFHSNVDPSCMVSLEALLTGVTTERVRDRPWTVPFLASRGPDGPWISRLSDELRDALCRSDARQRSDVAYRWHDESAVLSDGELAASFLESLTQLARIARERGEHIYGWVA